MHTFEFERNIGRFFSELEGFKPFTSAVSELAKSAAALNELLPGLAEGGSKLNESAAQVHSHLVHVHRTTSTLTHRQFFKALEHFQRSISQLEPSASAQTELIAHLGADVEQFATLYDAFLSSQSGKRALPLVLAAQSLQTKLQVLFDSLQLVEAAIGARDIPSSSEAPLSLWLPSHLDLADFGRRLQSLQSLYSEVCMLLSVSESEHPL